MLLDPFKNLLQKKLHEYEINKEIVDNTVILHGFIEIDETYDSEGWIRITFDVENNVATIEIKDVDNRDMFRQFRPTEYDTFEKIIDLTLSKCRIF